MAEGSAPAHPTVASPDDVGDPPTPSATIGGAQKPTHDDCESQMPRGAVNLASGGDSLAIPVNESYAQAHLPSAVTSSEDQDSLDPFDDDSAFGGSSSSSHMSLQSAVTRYRFENGRRYHGYKDGAYWAPNDEVHNDQQDLAHHLWLLTLDNRLHLSPLQQDVQSILDVGTGTGVWALDMADKYPSAHVIGVDLSPTQPTWTAPNCSFEIDDLCLPWTYTPGSFDYIHIREMFGSVDSWPFLFSQCFTALRSGGWCENIEHSVWPMSDDGSVGPDHVFTHYGRIMEDLARTRGKEFDSWKKSKRRMEAAGFVDVHEVRMKWPMSGWSSDPKMRELGCWNRVRVEQGIEGFAMRMLTTVAGWSYTEVQALVSKIRTALKDRLVHGYLDVSIVYGQKP